MARACSSAPRHGPDPGYEFAQLERFHQIVVRSWLQADNPVDRVAFTVSNMIGTLRSRRTCRAKSKPLSLPKLTARVINTTAIALEVRFCLHAVLGLQDLEAFALQAPPPLGPNLRVIVNNKYLTRHTSHRVGCVLYRTLACYQAVVPSPNLESGP